MKLNIADLFAGYGGMLLGLKKAGFEIGRHAFSEIDKHAIACYRYNSQNSVPLGSVTGVDGTQLKDTDMITFGFPCQDLSIAGKRSGLDGKRSGLFYHAMRVVRESKTKMFIWENVAGLLSSKNGDDFLAVCEEMYLSGYLFDIGEQNTAWYLPQNRQRIYCVAFRINYLFENLRHGKKPKLAAHIIAGYLMHQLVDKLEGLLKEWETKKGKAIYMHLLGLAKKELNQDKLLKIYSQLPTGQNLTQKEAIDIFCRLTDIGGNLPGMLTKDIMATYTEAYCILATKVFPDCLEIATQLLEQKLTDIYNEKNTPVEDGGSEKGGYSDGLFSISNAEGLRHDHSGHNATRRGSGGQVLPFSGSRAETNESREDGTTVTNLQCKYKINTIRSGGRRSITDKHNCDMVKITQRGRGYNKGGEHEISPTLSANSFQHNNHVVISHYGHKDKEPTFSKIVPTLKAESHGHTPMLMVSIIDQAHKNEGLREYSNFAPTLLGRDYKEPKLLKIISIHPNFIQNEFKSVTENIDNQAFKVQITTFDPKPTRIAGWHENENLIAAHRDDTKRSTVGEHVYHKTTGRMSALTTSHIPKVIQVNPSTESAGKQPYQHNSVYDTNGLSPALDQGAGRWSIKAINLPERGKKNQNGRRFKEEGDPSFTLTAADRHGILAENGEQKVIRRITEIECSRLQGLPDEHLLYGFYEDKNGQLIKKKIPPTQQYKMAGNGVTVDVVEGIGKELIWLLED